MYPGWAAALQSKTCTAERWQHLIKHALAVEDRLVHFFPHMQTYDASNGMGRMDHGSHAGQQSMIAAQPAVTMERCDFRPSVAPTLEGWGRCPWACWALSSCLGGLCAPPACPPTGPHARPHPQGAPPIAQPPPAGLTPCPCSCNRKTWPLIWQKSDSLMTTATKLDVSM